MALYLGDSEKLNVISNDIMYYLNLHSTTPITNGMILLSSDDYILKDSIGIIYLTVKESE